MKSGRGSRPLVLFYVLVVYVLLQFAWWTYLLIRTNNQVAVLQEEVLTLQDQSTPTGVPDGNQTLLHDKVQSELNKRWMMIAGEGVVFLILLTLVIVRTRNGFKREALLAERQKNFLLSVTHELRSPLASIGLQAETLIKRDLSKEKQSQILSHVLEDTERLNALIGNILLAARIDAHAFSIQKQYRSVSEFTAQLARKIAGGIGSQHSFDTQIEEGLSANFDDIAAHSIVANLLENAVKYSPAGTQVKVKLIRSGNHLAFSVADQGKGIPDAQKQTVFERFYRAGSEETRSTKGTGLGLYIAKYLSEMHGWQISVSDNAGGGSIFTVLIPEK